MPKLRTGSRPAQPVIEALALIRRYAKLDDALTYWHVERNSTAIHSQLIGSSASRVAAMTDGVMRQGTTICRDHRLGDADAEDAGQSVWLLLEEHLDGIRDPGALTRLAGHHDPAGMHCSLLAHSPVHRADDLRASGTGNSLASATKIRR